MTKPTKLHEVDRTTKCLIEDIEILLERAKEDSILGYVVVTVEKGSMFSTASACDNRLELLGALQMALYNVSSDN